VLNRTERAGAAGGKSRREATTKTDGVQDSAHLCGGCQTQDHIMDCVPPALPLTPHTDARRLHSLSRRSGASCTSVDSDGSHATALRFESQRRSAAAALSSAADRTCVPRRAGLTARGLLCASCAVMYRAVGRAAAPTRTTAPTARRRPRRRTTTRWASFSLATSPPRQWATLTASVTVALLAVLLCWPLSPSYESAPLSRVWHLPQP
jgi:hypothetical protein